MFITLGQAAQAPLRLAREDRSNRPMVSTLTSTFVRICIAGLQYVFLPPVMAWHSSMLPPSRCGAERACGHGAH
ncbi:hypothetical protein [Massilia oculi]|uniref:hypothetical protein n=1 Tax=Massilia oculi TaxID=945844 RepID=UPI001AAE43C7|nr:hypothetical protein [Massilia oculi]